MDIGGIKWDFVEKSGVELLTGEYRNTLDEKGRISFPSKLRSMLDFPSVMITQGLDGCLWLYTHDEWKNFSAKLMEQASPFNMNSRLVLRRLIGPAQEVEFDKSGRLSIPQSLREHAGLVKDCVIMGVNKYMELWDAKRFEAYINETEETFRKAAEDLSGIYL
ncbi:MAG: division/cell wall cluster transcriptional repressor MraZ [Spirochaetales bacterium]